MVRAYIIPRVVGSVNQRTLWAVSRNVSQFADKRRRFRYSIRSIVNKGSRIERR